MEAARTLRRLATEVALWYTIPALFLACYVGQYRQPSTAIQPHLLLMAIPLLTLMAVRLAAQRLRARAAWLRLLIAALAATLVGIMITYYVLVIIGLRSWGGVVSCEVMPTFFAQSTILTDAIGVPQAALPIAAVLVFGLLTALCWLYLGRFDWIGPSTRRLSTPTLLTILVGICLFVTLEAYQFSVASWTTSSEPISLTLYPRQAGLDLEGYTVNPVVANHLDALEDRARASYVPANSGAKKNLVLIVVDALRPDHMGIYGYDRDTTPHLARLISQHPTRIIRGVHSTCGDTACALYSLFSSKFTSEFSLRPFTLHQALRRNGYQMHLLLSGDQTFFYGLKSLYGQVDTFYDGTQAHGYFLNDDQLVVDRLATMPDFDGKPALFHFHLMSSHILRKPDSVPGRFQPAKRYALRDSIERGPRGVPLQTAVNFYDNGVLTADSVISALLERLQQKGYLRDTLVVITADHGESLGEHGLFTHANSVREELLRIPLVMISFGHQPLPAGPPRAIYPQVDIAPTILTELGLPIPATWTGRSIDAPAGLQFTYFEEHSFAGLIELSDAQHLWKYWVDRRSGTDHLFDLAADPQENVDRRAAIPASLLYQLSNRARANTSAGLAIN